MLISDVCTRFAGDFRAGVGQVASNLRQAADPTRISFFGAMIRAMRKYGLTARRYDTINSLPGTANGVTTKFMHFGEVITKAGHPALIFDSRVHNYIQFHRPVEFNALLSRMPKYRSAPTGTEYLVFLEAVSVIAAGANWRPDAVEMLCFSTPLGRERHPIKRQSPDATLSSQRQRPEISRGHHFLAASGQKWRVAFELLRHLVDV